MVSAISATSHLPESSDPEGTKVDTNPKKKGVSGATTTPSTPAETFKKLVRTGTRRDILFFFSDHKGFDINAQESDTGFTALHLLIDSDRRDMADIAGASLPDLLTVDRV